MQPQNKQQQKRTAQCWHEHQSHYSYVMWHRQREYKYVVHAKRTATTTTRTTTVRERELKTKYKDKQLNRLSAKNNSDNCKHCWDSNTDTDLDWDWEKKKRLGFVFSFGIALAFRVWSSRFSKASLSFIAVVLYLSLTHAKFGIATTRQVVLPTTPRVVGYTK